MTRFARISWTIICISCFSLPLRFISLSLISGTVFLFSMLSACECIARDRTIVYWALHPYCDNSVILISCTNWVCHVLHGNQLENSAATFSVEQKICFVNICLLYFFSKKIFQSAIVKERQWIWRSWTIDIIAKESLVIFFGNILYNFFICDRIFFNEY